MPTSLQDMMAAGRAAAAAITPTEAMQLLATGSAIAVDLRTAAEVAASGKVKGAVHVDRSHLEFKADPASPGFDPALRRDRMLLLYCASGGRATLAARTLAEMGFSDLRNLGGFKDWAAAGGAVDRQGE